LIVDNKVNDIDGNVYKTVTIGTQVWMAENLKTTKYNDGAAIPLVTDNNFINLTTPAYCWYNNDAPTYKNTYGAIYNWYTVNTGKLCPTGWHVPSEVEFNTLFTFLGGIGVAGPKLKEAGTTHWGSLNVGSTNESGFTALPGGGRGYQGAFYYIGNTGFWWSSTEKSPIFGLAITIFSFNSSPSTEAKQTNKEGGYSVRCLKN
jgi:uncharacterized protein (TIGR02145 family)